ncbi:hypothetical protein Rhe02_84380 [Rhizocola hellebori]|uniref:Lipoprotein n=1 Tax=Rhizocola hellebori TaxID=1392758 RepID=A0A8J3QJN4_9ACTN|nr:hypothetical protein [Rhizocola hellebori]GIH10371.1 hypothetical protein Rhe02_84380 [Rhizocola hellebori]
MRVFTGGIAVVLGLAAACGAPPAEAAPALPTHLSCASAMTVALVADHDESVAETRTPEQLAKDYAAVVAGSFSGQRKVVYRSAERTDIAFVDGQGAAQAVLSYRRHGGQGWRLEEGVNCA